MDDLKKNVPKQLSKVYDNIRADHYRSFYRFVFTYHREGMMKSVKTELCISLFELLFSDKFPLLSKFVTFVNDKQLEYMTLDEWEGVLDLLRDNPENLDNYDVMGASGYVSSTSSVDVNFSVNRKRKKKKQHVNSDSENDENVNRNNRRSRKEQQAHRRKYQNMLDLEAEVSGDDADDDELSSEDGELEDLINDSQATEYDDGNTHRQLDMLRREGEVNDRQTKLAKLRARRDKIKSFLMQADNNYKAEGIFIYIFIYYVIPQVMLRDKANPISMLYNICITGMVH